MYKPAPSLCSILCSPEGNPIPLMGVSIAGEVFGAQARLVVRQRYRNKEPRPIEAIYTFPLPSDAVLVGFAMECEGRRLEGQVKEREEAFQAYDDAVTAGHGAALLDQERRNVFTASVGNLLPGEETVIEVVYVQRLGADEGALRLMIPTLVAPRYMPGAPQGDRTGHGVSGPTDKVPDADRISPQIGAVSYGLSMNVVFDIGRDVGIESPSHDIEVTLEGKLRQRVTLRRDAVPLDRDLILFASGAEGVQAGVVAERRSGQDGTFALTVVPDLFDRANRAPARDVVFVVDTSGSMDGPSIEQARSALRLCLRHLAEGDRFQIISFSNTFTRFMNEMVPFTQRTLEQADTWVARLSASGGTEMLAPLLAAVADLGQRERPRSRIVVLLTDGQVGNEDEILSRVGDAAAGVRLYTFGIGTNVSDMLLRDLARRTGGGAEFIYPGERIDEKVTAQFARATAERVEEVSLRFSGIDAGELSPSELPALIDGEPWVVYGRYSEPGIGRAELRGVLRGERFFLEVPIELPSEADRSGLSALWAAARIRGLEDAETQLNGRRAEANKKRIAALSVEHGVASKYASFVVVEKRTGDRRAHGQPEARPVPVHGPAGWGRGAQDPDDGPVMRTRAGVVRPMMAQAMLASRTIARAPSLVASPPPPPMRISAPAGFASPPAPRSPASGGAPPPPMQRPPSAPAPVAPMPAAAAPGSSPLRAVGEAVRGAMGRLFGGGEASEGGSGSASSFPIAESPYEETRPATPSALRASGPPSSRQVTPQVDVTALLERQLANGLWDGASDSDAARLLATARALASCHAAQIDTAHPTFGAQIRKAVEAVCRFAADLAQKGGSEQAITAALTAAFLVASGRRLRAQVSATIQGSASTAVQALAAELTDSDAARKKLVELGVG